MTGRWERLAPTFPTLQRAHDWASHVARCSGRRCQVRPDGDRWRVYRATTEEAPRV